MNRNKTSPTRAQTGDAPVHLPAPHSDSGEEGTSSSLIETPVAGGKAASKGKLHDFADGGGSGGAEAFRRDQASRNAPDHP